MPKQTQRSGLVLAVLCLAAFMASLDLFIVNVAFDSIGRSFHGSSTSDLSWILNAYAIVYAAMLVPFGRLADRFSYRDGFLLGVAVFTAASAACAASSSLWELVLFRVLQAAGGALLTPTSLALVVASTSLDKRARSVRIWAASGAVAAAAGPVIGGLLLSASWRWVFLVNVPFGVLAIVGTFVFVPHARHAERQPLPDLLAAALLAVGIGALSLGVVKGPSWGWSSAGVIGSFAVAVLCVVAFSARSNRHVSPVVDPALLKIRSFAAANVASIVFSIAFAASLLSMVLWMQQVWHYSALRTGLGIAPGPLMVPIFAAVAQRLSTRLSPDRLIAIGCLLFGTGSVIGLSLIGIHPHYATEVLPGWIIGGMGVGFTLPTLLSSAAASLPADHASTGSGVINMSRQIGTVIGVSALVAILGTPHSATSAHHVFVTAWWTCAGACVLAAIAAVVITGRPRPVAATTPVAELTPEPV